jgi:ABC-type polysaccharide/polyol phosphate export permease
MREVITRFGRHNLGVLWLVGEPMMFTVGVAALWSAGGFNHESKLPIVPFAVTGYSSVLMWRNTVTRCSAAIQQNLNLLFHRRVKVIDILLTRILLECGGAMASFAVLTTLLVGGEWMEMPEDFLKVVGGMALLAWFALALGMLVGALASLSELIERIWHPMAYLLMPLAGAPYMVDWLPPPAREYVLLLPMVHCLELVREGLFRWRRADALRTRLRQRGQSGPDARGAAHGALRFHEGGRAVIFVENLVKYYRTRQGRRLVLDRLNFQVEAGCHLGILGRNGAGKSTLIRLLSGAELPTPGASSGE